MTTKGDRIKELRKRMKLTQAEFADRLGDVTRGAVGNWEHDQGIKMENLASIARKFSCSVDWLATGAGELTLGDVSSVMIPVEQVRIVGEVQAGAFRNAWEYQPEDQYSVFSPKSTRYNGIDKFGLKVVGPSMNKVYPNGTILICATLYELAETEFIHNKRYVVVCTDAHGDKEATVKELQIAEDGTKWLWPHSTDPNHQTPVVYPTPDAAEVTCELYARVLRAILPEE